MSDHSTWRAPIVLALLTLLGLIVGLLGDGPWDWACWIGLGLPVGVCAWFGLKRTAPLRSGSRTKATRPDGAARLPTIEG